MLTRCPHCVTVFRLGARQLQAAHGQVQCGTCFKIFDAIEYLIEDLPRASVESPSPPQPSAAAGQAPPQGASDAPRAGIETPVVPQPPATAERVPTLQGMCELPPAGAAASQAAAGIVAAAPHIPANADARTGSSESDAAEAYAMAAHDHAHGPAARIPDAGLASAEPARREPGEDRVSLPADADDFDEDDDDEDVTDPGLLRLVREPPDADPADPGPWRPFGVEPTIRSDIPDEPDSDALDRTDSYPPLRRPVLIDPDAEIAAPPEVVESAALRELSRVVVPPPLLREDEEERSGRGSRWLWSIAALLLLMLGAGQVAWRHMDEVLRLMPSLQPRLEWTCAVVLGCELPVKRDTAAVQLMSRDVRVHPRYRDTLLVNATIVNAARYSQPFPVLELSLFDTSGRLLGMRQFAPREYLDASIEESAGMPPGAPVHVVLEIAGASEDAVSFEFKFL